MELDADLGIDSIKRVEILSALQEAQPSLPHLSSQALGSLRTLGDIVGALAEVVGSNGGSPIAVSAAPARTNQAVSAVSATPAASVTSATSAASAGLSALLFSVVAEKTGYPVDILESSMELDADLGIDSIKRVEILSALQEAQPSLPHLSSQALGSLRTLGDIVGALAEVVGSNGGSPVAASEGGPPVDPSFGADLTRWPAQIQRLTLQSVPFSLHTASCVSIPKEGVVYIAADRYDLADVLAASAQSQGFRPQVLSIAELPAVLEAQSDLRGVILIAPFDGASDSFGALAVAKAAASQLQAKASAGGALFATISRIDGVFGLGDGSLEPQSRVESGALAGLTKTAAREWPQVHCRALDIALDVDVLAVAREIWSALWVEGPVEIGCAVGGWSSLSLQPSILSTISAEKPLTQEDIRQSLPIQRGDLVVVTGGARGVTATVALALAQACQPTLLLLGRSPLPEPEPPWLRELRDEASIKKALLQHTQGKPTPREIQRRCEEILRGREVHRNLAALQQAGARVLYQSLDIADTSAVGALLRSLQAVEGPVRGIIHGAGVLADRLIAEKRLEDAEKVYATKVQGFSALLAALDEEALRCVVLFSSSTARFGRIGQADYAMANETLNKIAQSLHRRLPHCVVRSMNWGPWDGGMVTPALKQIFEREGVGVIGLEEGALCMLQELSPKMVAIPAAYVSEQIPTSHVSEQPSAAVSRNDVEVVILGRLPEQSPLRLQRSLHLHNHRFLQDHRMRGVGVLPAAIMVEWMAEAAIAALPTAPNTQNWHWLRMDGMEVQKGCTVAEQAIPLVCTAHEDDRTADSLALSVVCESQSNGKTQRHARALLSFGTKKADIPKPRLSIPKGALEFAPYERLFHGPLFHCIESIEGCDTTGIAARLKAAMPPAAWMEQPPRQNWLLDPYWLDGAFQMIILWSIQQHGFPCLPTGFARLEVFQMWRPAISCEVRILMQPSTLPVLLADIEVLDPQGALMLRVESARSIAAPSLTETFRDL